MSLAIFVVTQMVLFYGRVMWRDDSHLLTIDECVAYEQVHSYRSPLANSQIPLPSFFPFL